MTVIPAQAGIHAINFPSEMDPRLRGDDGNDAIKNDAIGSNPRDSGCILLGRE